MKRSDLHAEVYERRDDSNAWGVEAIDMDVDGEIQLAVFSGPEARGRAVEYAREKYAQVIVAS